MRLFLKHFLCLMMAILLLNGLPVFLKAEDDFYMVADAGKGTIEDIESFYTYYEAADLYRELLDDYDNLIIYQGERVLKMEYGLVLFKTNEKGNLIVEYSTDKGNVSLNGKEGIDALYLNTSSDGNTITFRIGGENGSCDIDDVELIPFELCDVRPSGYMVIDGELNHLIKNQFAGDYYYKCYPIDKALSYLKEDVLYYSYDGHYFYDDFKAMSDDIRNREFENAINKEPYYNYYQYLPYRSFANYSLKDIEEYFYKYLGISGRIEYYDDQVKDNANDVVNRSELYDNLAPFITCQNIYGVNGLLSLAMAVNDSSYGKSFNAFYHNDLFAYSAYKRGEDCYKSVGEGIESFIREYLSNKYAYYKSGYYNGAFLGNKVSGLNRLYSNNPYYGQQCASFYYLFDKTMGEKDLNSYCIGISDNRTIEFYGDVNKKELLFKQNVLNEQSFIILNEEKDMYLIQLENSDNEDHFYDYSLKAYVDKDVFTSILNEDKMHDNDIAVYTIDAKEGTIAGKHIIKFNVLNGQELLIGDVENDGYLFDGEYKIVDADKKEYSLNYREIDHIDIKNDIKKTVSKDGCLDLRNGKIEVHFVKGKTKTIAINSDMLRPLVDTDEELVEININYHGKEISEKIRVVDNSSLNVDSLIDNNIASYLKNGSFKSDDLKTIKQRLNEIDYDYDIEELRTLDSMLLNKYRNNAYYRIDENDYDLSLSGLTLCLAEANITSLFKPFKDIYYVHVRSVSSGSKEKLSALAKAYGFEPVEFLNISYSLNMQTLEPKGAVIISIKPKDKQSDKIYSVYRLDENGDIVKCKTIQSENYVVFLTKKDGDFMVMEKDSVNNYPFPDYKENITLENSDPDNHGLFITGFVTLAIIFYGGALIIVDYNINKRKEKLAKEYKKLLTKA